MKTTLKILIVMLVAMAAGCIEDRELEPPSMSISYTDTQSIKFSWRNPAVLTVKITSEEDIERLLSPANQHIGTKTPHSPLTRTM